MSELDLSTDQARVSYGIGRQLGDQLRGNQRLGMVHRNLERMTAERQQALWQRGEQLLARLDAGEML